MKRTPRRAKTGFSIIELMVSMTVGLIIVASLGEVFVSTSRNQKEMAKSVMQIENGRYAIETLAKDIRLAGFYGSFYETPSTPASAPSPCNTTDTAAMKAALPLHVQAYPSASTSAATLTGKPDFSSVSGCSALLSSANLAAGSDVIVIRRINTQKLEFGTAPTANEIYLQTAPFSADVEIGNSGGVTTSDACLVRSTADNRIANDFNMTRKTGDCSGTHPVAADIYKLHTFVYFVAPCSKGTGTNGVCQTGDGNVPTLKRLELMSVSGTTKMKLVPLVEGVETLKVEYGVDSSPSTVDERTNMPGDGEPDEWKSRPSIAEMANSVAMRILVLARNNDETPGFSDGKSYVLCSNNSTACTASDAVLANYTKAATNDRFKRHMFTAQVRMDNPSMKREIPK